jgi:orotate phosphoribosyltransferase
VGHAYAEAVTASDLQFDMLFGPAYKGIPLVTITAAARATRPQPALCLQSQGGQGSWRRRQYHRQSAERAVLIVDDVITAGSAIRESIDIIHAAGARPAGVLLALDRQERAPESRLSAVQEVEQRFGIPVITVVNLADLMHHVSAQGRGNDLQRMQAYRERYGLAD